MTRTLKAGLVAVSAAAFLFACAAPAWAQRGGARGGGGASHGFSSGSRGFSSVSRAPVARAPMVRAAPRIAAPVNRTYAARSFVRTRSLNSTRVVTTRPWRDRYGRWHRGRSVVFLGAGYPGYYYYPYGFDYGDNDGSYDAQQPDYSQQPEQYVVEQPAPSPVQNAAAARPLRCRMSATSFWCARTAKSYWPPHSHFQGTASSTSRAKACDARSPLTNSIKTPRARRTKPPAPPSSFQADPVFCVPIPSARPPL